MAWSIAAAVSINERWMNGFVWGSKRERGGTWERVALSGGCNGMVDRDRDRHAIGVSQTGLRYSRSDIGRSRATYIYTCHQVWYWYNFSYLAKGDHFLDLVVPPATFREGLRYAHL